MSSSAGRAQALSGRSRRRKGRGEERCSVSTLVVANQLRIPTPSVRCPVPPLDVSLLGDDVRTLQVAPGAHKPVRGCVDSHRRVLQSARGGNREDAREARAVCTLPFPLWPAAALSVRFSSCSSRRAPSPRLVGNLSLTMRGYNPSCHRQIPTMTPRGWFRLPHLGGVLVPLTEPFRAGTVPVESALVGTSIARVPRFRQESGGSLAPIVRAPLAKALSLLPSMIRGTTRKGGEGSVRMDPTLLMYGYLRTLSCTDPC